MPYHRRKEDPKPSSAACAVEGCAAPGEHKAPKSPAALYDYQWLCLDHVREFNKKWDYFRGMQPPEIEAFMQDAVHGHRPTWQREDHRRKPSAQYSEALKAGIHHFFNWDQPRPKPQERRLPAKERKALAVMELSAPCSPEELKTRYRALVKRHHPDINPGDRLNEERFKAITGAYAYLMKLYENQTS